MQYQSTVKWKSNDQPFTAKTYDRTHEIILAGGQTIAGSSAPEFLGNAKLANPEELFVSALSSCFMLTFLYLAAMKNLKVMSYEDEAIGQLAKNSEGKMAMTVVTLRPKLLLVTVSQKKVYLLSFSRKRMSSALFHVQ